MWRACLGISARSQSAWSGPDGVPSRHVLVAALHVASMLDARGSQVEDADESYWHSATGGAFPPPDLRLGERLLVDVGLVDQLAGRLVPSERLLALLAGGIEDALATLLSDSLLVSAPPSIGQSETDLEKALASVIPDAERREQLLLALGRRFDDSHRRQVGAVGEQVVVNRLRVELDALGYPALARDVRQVSLLSDQLGYDVVAPRIAGPQRLLEVKSTEADVTSLSDHAGNLQLCIAATDQKGSHLGAISCLTWPSRYTRGRSLRSMGRVPHHPRPTEARRSRT